MNFQINSSPFTRSWFILNFIEQYFSIYRRHFHKKKIFQAILERISNKWNRFYFFSNKLNKKILFFFCWFLSITVEKVSPVFDNATIIQFVYLNLFLRDCEHSNRHCITRITVSAALYCRSDLRYHTQCSIDHHQRMTKSEFFFYCFSTRKNIYLKTAKVSAAKRQ